MNESTVWYVWAVQGRLLAAEHQPCFPHSR